MNLTSFTIFFLASNSVLAEGELWNLDRSDRLDEYLIDTSKPVIVIDLDDTVVSSGIWNLFRLLLGAFTGFGLGYQTTPPFLQAAESLSTLQSTHHIVFITARFRQAAGISLDWLDSNSFPTAPLFTAPSLATTVSSSKTLEYKSSACKHLERLGLTIGIGIGDKATDIKAFSDTGAKTILILDSYKDGDLGETFALFGVASYESGNAPHLILFGQDNAWTAIADYVLDR